MLVFKIEQSIQNEEMEGEIRFNGVLKIEDDSSLLLNNNNKNGTESNPFANSEQFLQNALPETYTPYYNRYLHAITPVSKLPTNKSNLVISTCLQPCVTIISVLHE